MQSHWMLGMTQFYADIVVSLPPTDSNKPTPNFKPTPVDLAQRLVHPGRIYCFNAPLVLAVVLMSILQVPTTVLQALFTLVCESRPAVRLPFEAEDPRHILSLVCAEWAAIVYSIPFLWDTIIFTGNPDPFFYYAPYPLLQQFLLCIDRSAQNMLSISLDILYGEWAFSIVDIIVIPYISRIKSLKSPIFGDDEICKFLTIPEGQFSALEVLDICFFNTNDHPASSFHPLACLQFNALKAVPRLRVALIHILNGLHPSVLHLPLPQLTILSLGASAIESKVFLNVLRSATLLEEAFFYVQFPPPKSRSAISSRASVEMQRLRTLRLRLVFPNNDKRLFSLLRFPSLQHLWIEMHGDFQYWYMPIYTNLLTASTRTLRELILIDFNDQFLSEAAGNEDETLQRRSRESSPYSLETFFEVISNVRSLFLPVGLHLHASTVEKIALCALLPYLEELEVGTLDAWPLLDALKYRRSRVMGASLGASDQSTSSGGDRPMLVIKCLHLLIPLQGLTAAAANALADEMDALDELGVTCRIVATPILPLAPMPADIYIPSASN